MAFILILSFSTLTQGQPASQPDTIIAEGRHIMGDRDSRNDARQYAIMEAKKRVIEQAGTFLKSHATIENFQLSEQEIESYSAGLIKTEILDERTEPVGETSAIVVKIRAVIDPEEIQRQIAQQQKQEATNLEIVQLQDEYKQLTAELESLKNTQPAAAASQPPDRKESWKRLNQLEMLIKLSAETNKRRPDIKYSEALARQILQDHPNLTIVNGYLGIGFYKQNQLSRAITHLKKAVKTPAGERFPKVGKRVAQKVRQRFQKEQALFHFFLARCYRQQGNKILALKHFRTAKKMDPDRKFPNI